MLFSPVSVGSLILSFVELGSQFINLLLHIVEGPLLGLLHLNKHLLHLFKLLEVVGLHLFELLLLGDHHILAVLLLAEVSLGLVHGIQS